VYILKGFKFTLTKVGSDYWVGYEASGVLYYKTSADFVTWSAATNLNTITGLTNSHYNPYLFLTVREQDQGNTLIETKAHICVFLKKTR
jgi:hypothetical protein